MSERRPVGQALVEFALILPVLLLLILGSVETGALLIQKAEVDRRTQVVADWAADHDDESWHSVANQVLDGCQVTVTTPRPHQIRVDSHCPHHAQVLALMDGLTVSSTEYSTRREFELVFPSPIPVASGS